MLSRGGDDNPETKLSSDLLLRAYQLVLEQGERQADGSRHLRGISVMLDIDGYGVTVSDGVVSARVLFHNKVAVQTPNSRSLSRFRKLLLELVGS
ncbi:MAG: DUF3081 family protein [Pseudomonadota bacterium]